MKNRQHFTLFELLIAVGLLVMLTMVLLKMFLLSSTLWTASDEQARLYADAKTALSVISDDLNNIFYQDTSDAADPTTASQINLTAPLWLEAYPISGAIGSYTSYGADYTAGLHFMTHNALGSNATYDRSGISMVHYRFLPPTQNGANWSKFANSEGALLRAIINENNGYYAYVLNRQAGTSMNSVFYLNHSSIENSFKRIVTGVLDFQILAYPHVADDDWDDDQYPADLISESGTKVPYVSGKHGNGQTDLTGAKNIETIQIVLTLMVPERIPELRKLLNESRTQEAKEYLFQYSRTFRKTIRIRNRVADKEE